MADDNPQPGGGNGGGENPPGAGADALGGGALNGGGSGGVPLGDANIFSSLSDNDRAFADAKGWPKVGLNGIVEQYRSLETKIGDPDALLRLPGEKAKPEDWDAVWSKLGKPAEAIGDNGYKFTAPENVTVDENLDGWFRATAHKHNLTEAQAAGLFEDWNAAQGDTAAEFVAKSDQEMAKLKVEQGANWPAFEASAKQAVQQFVPRDGEGNIDGAVLDQMEKSLGTSVMMKVWGNIGAQMSNMGAGDFGGGGGGAGGGAYTPDGAKAEIDKMTKARADDPKHPLNDQRHPQYKDEAAKWARMHTIAYPDTFNNLG